MPSTHATDWLIRFQGRNTSLSTKMNFLFRQENIYVMDNHRAALWCWMQHIDLQKRYSLFHIDAHYDTRSVKGASWLSSVPYLPSIPLDTYLQFGAERTDTYNQPLICWDNYLSLFLEKHPALLTECFLATHQIGDAPEDTVRLEHKLPTVLSEDLPSFLTDYPNDGWIINLDIDYFFCKSGDDYIQMFSDVYIDRLIEAINEVVRRKTLLCMTIALSPECCGGWSASEEMCSRISQRLGIDFNLQLIV
jgi:hypothetical protein